MDQSTKDMLQGLRTAMQAERTGHEFYKMAAKTTQDPTAREVFEHLATEEQEHFEFLATHYRSLLDKGTLSEDAKLDPSHALHADAPIFSSSIKGRLKQAHFEMSALAVAVQLELNGINHYREQASKASSPEAKGFYNELVAWETKHYSALIKQQQDLQEAYWAEAGFEPF